MIQDHAFDFNYYLTSLKFQLFINANKHIHLIIYYGCLFLNDGVSSSDVVGCRVALKRAK